MNAAFPASADNQFHVILAQARIQQHEYRFLETRGVPTREKTHRRRHPSGRPPCAGEDPGNMNTAFWKRETSPPVKKPTALDTPPAVILAQARIQQHEYRFLETRGVPACEKNPPPATPLRPSSLRKRGSRQHECRFSRVSGQPSPCHPCAGEDPAA